MEEAGQNYFFGRPLLLLAGALLVLLAVPGCLPEEQWLDDSSGFVYGVGKDATQEVRFYDMARRAERILWTGSSEAGYDLDPAAQVLYVFEPLRGKGAKSFDCRLLVYDVKTNRLMQSTRWLTWGGNHADVHHLYLSKLPNRQSHFLVRDDGRTGGARNEPRNAILDAVTETLIDVPGLDLEIIPDGSGFVARSPSIATAWDMSLKSKEKLDAAAIEQMCRESVWIVDLKGIRFRMTWDESALRRAVALYGEELTKAEASAKPEDATYAELLWDQRSRWQGDGNGLGAMTLLTSYSGSLQIDIKRRTITYVAGLTVAKGDKDLELSPSLDSGPSVLLLKLKDVEYRVVILDKCTEKTPYHVARLEAQWPVQGKTKTLLSRVNIAEISRFTKASRTGSTLSCILGNVKR